MNDPDARVVCSPEATALIRELKEELGPLLFHQSGGCCEGTAPMCFRQSDFRVGSSDILLGTLEGCPFYIGAATYRYFASSRLIIDVTRGAVDSFSLEAPRGVRFVTRSRILNEALTPRPEKKKVVPAPVRLERKCRADRPSPRR